MQLDRKSTDPQIDPSMKKQWQQSLDWHGNDRPHGKLLATESIKFVDKGRDNAVAIVIGFHRLRAFCMFHLSAKNVIATTVSF
jgi:hypothetical protein